MLPFGERRRIVLARRERERVARLLAFAHTGFDPGLLVVPGDMADPRIRGGFRVPLPAAPLWHQFLAAADAVIADRSAAP